MVMYVLQPSRQLNSMKSSRAIRSLMMMMMMMMMTEMVLETSVQYRYLTQLIAWEDFIEISMVTSDVQLMYKEKVRGFDCGALLLGYTKNFI